MTGDGPATYAIWVQGALSAEWQDRLGGLQVRRVEPGSQPITELVGTVVDQTALTGVLTTLYELGLPILSVERLVEQPPQDENTRLSKSPDDSQPASGRGIKSAGGYKMKKRIELWLLLFTFFALSAVVLQTGKAYSGKTEPPTTQPQATDTQKQNVQQYIELLGSNVRDQKAQIMGAVLELNGDDAAKFWPVYDEYDAELTKLNDLRASNIQEYASGYDQLTDQKANELVKSDLDTLKQRAELLSKYYERLKGLVGPINAARFVQVENQLLLIIDLQIDSSLPIGQG